MDVAFAHPAVGAHAQSSRDIVAVLDELERLDRARPSARDISLEEFIELVRSSLAAARVNTRQSLQGIEILDITSVGERRSRVLFLAGLVEGAVPAKVDPDALLSFAVRNKIGLPDRNRLQAERRMELYRAISSASERLFLCRPRFQDETRLLRPMMWERIEAVLSLAPSNEPSRPTSWRRALCKLGQEKTDVPPLETLLGSDAFSQHAALRAFAHARAVEMKRRPAAAPTIYAGVLSPELLDKVQRVYDRTHQYSAGELETYVRCPFRFFAKRLLALAPIEEPEEEIGPREKGTVLHAIFREFYTDWSRRRSRRITSADRDEARELLTAIARAQLSRQPYSGFVWSKFLDRLLGAVSSTAGRTPGLFEKFVEAEIVSMAPATACTPQRFEIGFGRQRRAGPLDPASVEKPVSVLAGDRPILLRGIIDRIDTNDQERTFCVLDYKTGGNIPAVKDVREGLSLQLPVYIMAASDLLGETYRFAAAGYFQTKDVHNCGKFRWLGDDVLAPPAMAARWTSRNTLQAPEINDWLAREREVIGRAVVGIEAGRFHVTTLGDDKAACRSCDYKHICRYDGITQRTFQDRT